jgi:hypothetical protein
MAHDISSDPVSFHAQARRADLFLKNVNNIVNTILQWCLLCPAVLGCLFDTV